MNTKEEGVEALPDLGDGKTSDPGPGLTTLRLLELRKRKDTEKLESVELKYTYLGY
jgi:hypothetical protein